MRNRSGRRPRGPGSAISMLGSGKKEVLVEWERGAEPVRKKVKGAGFGNLDA